MATITTGPSPLDWSVYVGDENTATFVVSADDGTPVDLTGAVIEAQARAAATDAAPAAVAAVTLSDPLSGRFEVSWDGEELRTLLGAAETWKGVWDLQVLAVGEVLPTTLVRGVFVATLDVTRP